MKTVRHREKPQWLFGLFQGGPRILDIKDFLMLWKDADPDIPILKQAQAEYANLN